MTRSWDDFRDDVSNLLRLVEQTERAKQSESAPIPVLAAPLTSPQDVRDAFDVGVLAPEMLGEGVDSETHERLEQWAYKGGFEVVPTEGPSFVAGVSLGGEALGELTFSVDLTDPERVAWDVAATPEAQEDHRLREIAAISENPRWIQIRYESGHTISEGAVYGVRYRDVRFRAWQFPVLRLGGKKIDITKEKPVRPNSNVFDREAVGEQDSLFCWVARTWPEGLRGWLACDDGSMEIADFVHLASTEPPLLSLIHVKGSHSDKPARGISVSDYEVVTSQAIKNLRFLDDLIVSVGLQIGFDKRIGSLVWRDGALQADRRGMLAALGVLGSNYARRVVILQPRLTRREHDLGRAEQDKGVESGRVARLRQLDTLLVSVEASCRDLGADLLVIGDGSE
jgi:hypothetical protein